MTTAPPAELPITLADAIAQAAEQGPTYRADAADERAASALFRSRLGDYLPRATVSWTGIGFDNQFMPTGAKFYQLSLGVSFSVWDNGRRELALSQRLAASPLLRQMLRDEADLTVLLGPQVIFPRTVRLPTVTEPEALARALLAEGRRTMIAAQNQLGGRKVEEVVIFGDGLQSRDFVYVEDVVQAFIKASEAPGVAGKVYNIGTGGSVTVLDLIETLNHILGTTITAKHEPPRAGDVRYSQADITRARSELGYEPTVCFPEGLRRTVEWLAEA